jgi:4-amino-4-deoxy-L-arabinose transferase-like glycosyltransferase
MRQKYLLVYLLALLKLVLPFFLQNGVYEPHRDEFLYLAEGRHMAWGYMEVPPLLSVFAWLTNLFGGGFFWIKFWPSLFGALTYLVVGRMVLALGGRSFALLLSFLPFVFGAYLRTNYLFQPNSLEIFFWTLLAYAVVRYVQSRTEGEAGLPGGLRSGVASRLPGELRLPGESRLPGEAGLPGGTRLPGEPWSGARPERWLWLAGIAAGLGMLSKYTMLFFAASLIGGLLLTPQRRLLHNRRSLYALAIAFLLFLPNLLWQWRHGFPVVYHMNELQRTQLQYISPLTFFTEQLLFNLAVIYVWIHGLVFVGFSRDGRPYRFIGWAFVILLGLLALGHAKGYYSLGVYPILFGFGAARIERLTAAKRRYLLRYVMVAASLVGGYAFIMIGLPVMPPQQLAEHYAKTGLARSAGALRWEDLKDHPLPQDFADMLSWKEMTRKVAAVYATLNAAEKSQTLLFCDNYGQAGAVNYYGPQYGLPPAYSANASFVYWMPEDYFRYNVLLLVTDDQQEMQHPFIHEFASAKLMDSITNPFAREYGSLILLLKGPSPAFRKAFVDKINKTKFKATATGVTGSGESPNLLEQGGSMH